MPKGKLRVSAPIVMAPAGDVQAPAPWMIVMFAGVALTGNRIVVGRNRAEEALRASEHHHRQLFRDNPQAMWIYELRNVQGASKRIRPVGIRPDAWWAGLADWSVTKGR